MKILVALFCVTPLVLFWAFLPLAQHEIDRTLLFWLVWSAFGLVIVGSGILYWRRPAGGYLAFSSDSAFTTVRTVRTPMEAGLLIDVLQRAGLHPVELPASGHYSVAGADIDYPVRVPREESMQAREVLSSYDDNAA